MAPQKLVGGTCPGCRTRPADGGPGSRPARQAPWIPTSRFRVTPTTTGHAVRAEQEQIRPGFDALRSPLPVLSPHSSVGSRPADPGSGARIRQAARPAGARFEFVLANDGSDKATGREAIGAAGHPGNWSAGRARGTGRAPPMLGRDQGRRGRPCLFRPAASRAAAAASMARLVPTVRPRTPCPYRSSGARWRRGRGGRCEQGAAVVRTGDTPPRSVSGAPRRRAV